MNVYQAQRKVFSLIIILKFVFFFFFWSLEVNYGKMLINKDFS